MQLKRKQLLGRCIGTVQRISLMASIGSLPIFWVHIEGIYIIDMLELVVGLLQKIVSYKKQINSPILHIYQRISFASSKPQHR